MYTALFSWPDELQPITNRVIDSGVIATLIRLQRFREAEVLLLSAHSSVLLSSQDRLKLLLTLRICQRQLDVAIQLFCLLPDLINDPIWRFYRTLLWIQGNDLEPLSKCDENWWHLDQTCLPLLITHVHWHFLFGRPLEAEQLIEHYKKPLCMELVRLQSRIYSKRHHYQQAAEVLLPAAKRFPQHIGLQAEMAQCLIDARSRDLTVPFIRDALHRHGNRYEFLWVVGQIKQLKREPAVSRRCYLQLNAEASVKNWLNVDPVGLVAGYEQSGYVSWMPYLLNDVFETPVENSAVQHNNCLYLASIESDQLGNYLKHYVQKLTSLPQFSVLKNSGLLPSRANYQDLKRPLRIAWLIGDLSNHPVARFLLAFLSAGSGSFRHQHILVNTKDHLSESYSDRFEHISGLSQLDVGSLPPNQKLASIRDVQPHVAIDLSGWTDANFAIGFLARMAPVQINYLGYFASTGIPSMDAWLGDEQLFPASMSEWHSEEIVRLKRCFIAWDPPDNLAEAHVDLTDAPSGSEVIRFGSFNHNRKLSDKTLFLWARILDAIPGAQLILKANHKNDKSPQILLRRRMIRCGLDIERVIWLPIAPTPVDHLAQYAQMDVALDCFPNGGCTTTCEALWMGVPVITLTGKSYVSRMSTAVLHGAGLPALCAANEDEYLRIALAQAENLSWLRQNRGHWRKQLQQNQLGDAADLMNHLEASFVDLYRQSAERSLTNA